MEDVRVGNRRPCRIHTVSSLDSATSRLLIPETTIDVSDGPAAAGAPRGASVVFCERARDVISAMRREPPRRSTELLVAATPEAAWQCMRAGRAYAKLEDFYREEVLCELSEPMMALQVRWADHLDEVLLRAVPAFGEWSFRPARRHFFFLKVLSDQLFMCTLALASLFAACRPQPLRYVASARPASPTWDLFFDESVYRLILPACAEAYGVPLAEIPVDHSVRPHGWDRLSSHGALQVLPPHLQARLRAVRSVGLTARWHNRGDRRGAPLLVFKAGYDVSVVVRRALERGWTCRTVGEVGGRGRLVPHAVEDVERALAEAWQHVSHNETVRRSFRWLGVNLWPTAEPRLYHWWHHVIPETWQAFLRARQDFVRRRPTAVLLWSPWGPLDQGVLHAAQSLGVPTATYQHGGFEGSCEFIMNEVTDLRQADYRFVYGPGVERYYRERRCSYEVTPATPISVGSARIEGLRPPSGRRVSALRRRLGGGKDQPLVLYVPTMYMRHRRYMACEDYGNVPYFELQAAVIGTMREHPDIRFVYKAFPKPTPDPVVDFIAERCPNCRVVHHISLPELFWACDAHVIDIPSTGLLEALLTPRPILAFADKRYVRLRSEARAALAKRVVLTEDSADFLEQLRGFLGAGRFADVTRPDQEFLRAYGVAHSDGGAALRVLQTLEMLGGESRSSRV